jgi:hypothetical protein
MARFRSDRLNRASVEHVLDGHPAAPASRALTVLVAAGRAPAHRGELAREESAVAAFRAARACAQTAAAVGSPAPLRRSLTRMLTVKGVAAATVVAGGGLAVAAATGALPSMPFLPESPPSQGVGPAGSGYGPAGRSPSPGTTGQTGSPGGGNGRSGPAGVGAPGTVPAAAVPGLCRAYLARPAGQARRVLETPPYAELVAAAGSADAVPAYCTVLVSPSATVPAPPAPTGTPAGSPAAASPPASTKTPKASKTPKAGSIGKATVGKATVGRPGRSP